MTEIPAIDLALFFLALLAAMALAVAETAITSASRSRLDDLADRGVPSALAALRIKDRDEDRKATVLISTFFLLAAASMFVSPYIGQWAHGLSRYSQQAWLDKLLIPAGVALFAILISSVFLVLATLSGRAIGVRFAESLVLNSAGWMFGLSRLLSLPRRMLTAISAGLFRPLHITPSFHIAVTSEENLMDILEDGAKTGLLDRTEHELIESILQFTDTTAREVMIPRTDIVAVEMGMSADTILEKFLEEGFTRMPVYVESLDNIVGVVYAKDVISLVQHKDLIILQDIIRPAFIVPETKSISQLLREFQLKSLHMAIVVDEFGGTEGIITMEDILEEIVGDIRDEYDEEESLYTKLPDGSIEVEAMINITDFNEYDVLHIPESEDYDTIGGFVTMLFGRIPEAGESITHETITIDVLEAEERRVKRVRLSRSDDSDVTDI
jgi:putative hemolysin